jgi:Mor family transcriptional regulator
MHDVSGEEFSLAEDMIMALPEEGISSEAAQKAVRALCRYFGGQMVYIPGRKERGKSAASLRDVIAGAVGENRARLITEKIMRLYGGLQLYIPLERCAFRKTIALEIYERMGKDGVTMNNLAREYNISFTFAYRLWREGQREKAAPSMPFLPFLEMAGGQAITGISEN